MVASLYVPMAHAAQVRSFVASPSAVTRCPAAHTVRATHAVVGSASSSQVPSPSSHATRAASPPAQYSPALHASQVGGVVASPAAVCTVPAAHASASRHKDWFGPDVYVPSAHAMQARSFVGLPAVDTYVPAVHTVHASHCVALGPSL